MREIEGQCAFALRPAQPGFAVGITAENEFARILVKASAEDAPLQGVADEEEMASRLLAKASEPLVFLGIEKPEVVGEESRYLEFPGITKPDLRLGAADDLAMRLIADQSNSTGMISRRRSR